MRQLLRRTRSTGGLYARFGEVEDGQLALAIWCSQRPEEEREFTYAAAESFVPSFKISESRYKAERDEVVWIKREESQRRDDRRCTTIKRERSRQIKKEMVEDELDIYAVPEESNGGSQSERNIKRKRQESRTRRKKKCTKRSRVVKNEVVEGVTYQVVNEERAASPASKRGVGGKRRTTGEKLPTRTQPARQCRIKASIVERALDEAVAEHGNDSSRRTRKVNIKPEPLEEEQSALYDITICQYGDGEEGDNPGEIEAENVNGAESTGDEREVLETLTTQSPIVERAKDDHPLVVLRDQVKPLGDATDAIPHNEAGDTEALRSTPEDVATDTGPTRTTLVGAVSEDIFDENVQEHSQSSNLENTATLPEDVVMQCSGQDTPDLEPVFTGPCADIIEEYGSGSCDGRDYDDQSTLSGSLSAALFAHGNTGHQSFEEHLQTCNSALSKTTPDSGDGSGIALGRASPERYVPDSLPQRRLHRLIVDSNPPPVQTNQESLLAVGERDSHGDLNMTSNNLPDSAIEIELLCDHEVVSEHSQHLPSVSITLRHGENGDSVNEDSTHRRASSIPRKSPSQITQQELRKRLIAGKQKSEAKHPGIVDETARRRKQQKLSLRIRSEPYAQQREDLISVVRFNVEEGLPTRKISQEQQLREMEREEQMIFTRKRRIRKAGYLDIAGHRFTSSKEAFKFCRRKQKEQRRNEKREHRRRKYPGFC